MNNISDTKRLADAVTALAATPTEIMTEKLRAISLGQEQTFRTMGQETEQKIAHRTIEPVLTKKQMAKHFGITARTLENWMKRGYVPHLKLGRNVRFNVTDVHRHLEACHRICRLRL
jgi:excisionase family DNA binding protein